MKIIRSNEVSTLLGIPHFSILKAFREGRIPGKKVGKYWFTTQEQLERFFSDSLIEIKKPKLRAVS
jgi:hypothetical protein